VSRRERRIFVIEPLVLATAIAACFLLSGCSGQAKAERMAAMATGGSPERGRALIHRYGCVSCHTIPGVEGTHTIVGPPLAGIATRTYIAGVLVNQPDNMVRWIRNPPAVDSLTAMPFMGVTERDARDIASYLYTLQ
jgi:cytochrome c2